MTRLACLLVLSSVAMVVLLALQTNGSNAIVFSFAGVPLLAAGIGTFAVARWRAGAFRAPARRNGDRT